MNKAVEALAQFPGIGKKSALRMVLHLLKGSEQNLQELTAAMGKLKTDILFCSQCHNISDTEICSICTSPNRDQSIVCVVKEFQDIISIENTGQYTGLYHVLGGLISPIDGIGPNDLKIQSLLARAANSELKEVLIALGATMESDTTEFYLAKKCAEIGLSCFTLSRGISVGGELEYADEITLGRSIKNRTSLNQ